MKFLKILTISSVVLFILTTAAVIFGWIKFVSGISPLIFGISFLAMTTSMNLIKYNQNTIKWLSFSLAFIGFLILSLANFKILEMKDFWYLGVVPLSISILLGLFYQIQLLTNLKRRFFIFGRLLTSFICGFLILVGLQIDNPKIYLTGKVVLTIFTIYVLIGSLLKTIK